MELEGLLTRNAEGPYIFSSSRGIKPIHHTTISTVIGEIARGSCGSEEPYKPGDVRRTVETLLGSSLARDRFGARAHRPALYAQRPHIKYDLHMSTAPSAVINLRTPAAQRTLIDRAAQLQGKTRTEFMLEASREKAQQVLLDQTLFSVSAKQYKAFVALMDAPLGKNVPLQRLLAKRAPWE